MAKEIVKAQHKQDSLTLTQQLLTPCEIALSRELEITAGNAKTVLTKSLSQEFFRVFSSYPAQVIEWAFRMHRATSDFWPSIRQIAELCEECGNRNRLEEKAALQNWTPEGLKQWSGILEGFLKKFGEMPTAKKRYRPEHAVKNSRETLKAQAARLAKR